MLYDDLVVSFILSVFLIIFLAIVISSVKIFYSFNAAQCGSSLSNKTFIHTVSAGEKVTLNFHPNKTVTYSTSTSSEILSVIDISAADTSYVIKNTDLNGTFNFRYGFIVRNCSGKNLNSMPNYYVNKLSNLFSGEPAQATNNNEFALLLTDSTIGQTIVFNLS